MQLKYLEENASKHIEIELKKKLRDLYNWGVVRGEGDNEECDLEGKQTITVLSKKLNKLF